MENATETPPEWHQPDREVELGRVLVPVRHSACPIMAPAPVAQRASAAPVGLSRGRRNRRLSGRSGVGAWGVDFSPPQEADMASTFGDSGNRPSTLSSFGPCRSHATQVMAEHGKHFLGYLLAPAGPVLVDAVIPHSDNPGLLLTSSHSGHQSGSAHVNLVGWVTQVSTGTMNIAED